MARSTRVVLAHAGALTAELVQLIHVLDLWRVNYAFRSLDAGLPPAQDGAVTLPADSAILVRSWAWPNEPPAFMRSITTTFAEQWSARGQSDAPIILDVLLDSRYAGHAPEPGAALTVDVTAQAWREWTAQLRAALHVGRSVKSEAAWMAAIFAAPPLAADVTPSTTPTTALGQIVSGYRLDRVVWESGERGEAFDLSWRAGCRPPRAGGDPPHAAARRADDRADRAATRAVYAGGADTSRLPASQCGAGRGGGRGCGLPLRDRALSCGDHAGGYAGRQPGAAAAGDGGDVLAQLAAAVDSATAHGIILSDLSPSNILLDASGHALIASVGYPASDWAAEDRREVITALGATLYALTTGRVLRWEANDATGATMPPGKTDPEPWRLRLDLPAPAEAAILGALIRRPQFATGAALTRAFRGGLEGLWTENVTRASSTAWLEWWRSGAIRGSWTPRNSRRLRVRAWQAAIGAAAVALIVIAVVLSRAVTLGVPLRGGSPHTSAAAAATAAAVAAHSGGSQNSASFGLAGVITVAGNPTPVLPAPTGRPGPTNPTTPISTKVALPGPTSTGSPAPGPTGTVEPTPGPSTTPSPGPTATPGVTCLASGTSFNDTFLNDPIGSQPSGYLMHGSSQPAVPDCSARQWQRGKNSCFPSSVMNTGRGWAIHDDGSSALCAPYTVTAELSFLSDGDRGGHRHRLE